MEKKRKFYKKYIKQNAKVKNIFKKMKKVVALRKCICYNKQCCGMFYCNYHKERRIAL